MACHGVPTIHSCSLVAPLLMPAPLPPRPPALRRELFAQLVRVMRELAAFAGCRPQDLALLPNATTGAAPPRGLQCKRSALTGSAQIDQTPHCRTCMSATCAISPTLACNPLLLLPPTGLNTVVQSWRGRLRPGDAILSLDIGYGSVKKMLAAVAEQTGAQHVELAVQLPVRCAGVRCC